MRGRLCGLAFMFALCCLMCLPFIVSSDTESGPPEPVKPVIRDEAILSEAGAQKTVLDIRKSVSDRIAYTKAGVLAGRTEPPDTDANGLPVLRTSYIRSNYQAFCLTGNGG